MYKSGVKTVPKPKVETPILTKFIVKTPDADPVHSPQIVIFPIENVCPLLRVLVFAGIGEMVTTHVTARRPVQQSVRVPRHVGVGGEGWSLSHVEEDSTGDAEPVDHESDLEWQLEEAGGFLRFLGGKVGHD